MCLILPDDIKKFNADYKESLFPSVIWKYEGLIK